MSRASELRALAEKATKGPWSNGPTTPAGNVWVYADGEPIGEPDPGRTGFRAWFGLGFGRKVRGPEFTAIQNMRAANAECDAQFIAAWHPVTALSALDAIRTLRDEMAEIRSELYCHGTDALSERLSVKADAVLSSTSEWSESQP